MPVSANLTPTGWCRAAERRCRLAHGEPAVGWEGALTLMSSPVGAISGAVPGDLGMVASADVAPTGLALSALHFSHGFAVGYMITPASRALLPPTGWWRAAERRCHLAHGEPAVGWERASTIMSSPVGAISGAVPGDLGKVASADVAPTGLALSALHFSHGFAVGYMITPASRALLTPTGWCRAAERRCRLAHGEPAVGWERAPEGVR
jgi:uncharacterized membrane protein